MQAGTVCAVYIRGDLYSELSVPKLVTQQIVKQTNCVLLIAKKTKFVRFVIYQPLDIQKVAHSHATHGTP